jgi:hypothetical protein
MSKYQALASLQVPSWATSMVSNYRSLANIPTSVNDVTIFVAVESNNITTFNYEDQVPALCDALGIEWKG